MTSLPTWAVWVLSFGSPLLTAAIAVVAQVVIRRGAEELETRSKREEVMRNLRWAAELAVSDDVRKARLGNRELRALQVSRMLDDDEVDFIFAALDAALDVPVHAIEQAEQAGGDVEIVATPGRFSRSSSIIGGGGSAGGGGRLMPKTRVVVTDAQVEAARMIVDHDRSVGRETSEAIRRIAEAVPEVAELSPDGQRK